MKIVFASRCENMFDIVIEGKLVDPINGMHETRLGISGERIEKIGDGLQGNRHIRADGLVLPGFIDPHVHLRDFGWAYKEDYATGTRAALNGGVTTVADMPNIPVPTITRARVEEKIEKAKHCAAADVLVYGGVCVENLGVLESMGDIVAGYKIFTCKSTGDLFLPPKYLEEALRRIANTGKPVAVHCEDQEIIDRMIKQVQKKDKPRSPYDHSNTRPAFSEIKAIGYVLDAAKKFKGKLNIVHLSTERGLSSVREYRRKNIHIGTKVVCEAAPHHLYFTIYDMATHDTENHGAKLKMNPPLRMEKDKKAILDGLRNGYIEMLATDHAPHTLEEKRGEDPPSGVPGLDDYGMFVCWLHNLGIGIQRLAQVTSYNAAQFFGLQDRGRIIEGFAADLTIISPNSTRYAEWKRYTKCGWSPYENENLPGRVDYTIRRGKIVAEKGRVLV